MKGFIFKFVAVLAVLLLVACGTVKEKMSSIMGKGTLSVTEEVTISASISEVSEIVGDFYGLHNWHPAVRNTRQSSEKDVRVLLLNGGFAKIHEKQTSSNNGRGYSYYMTDVGPLPVQDYSSTITLKNEGEDTRVIWEGSFDAANGEEPYKAIETVRGIYRSGLDNLVTMFGG